LNSTATTTGAKKKSSDDASNAMNGKTSAVLLSVLLVACVQTQPPEVAAPAAPSLPPAPAPAAALAPATESPPPADHIVYIRRASCQDLLKLAPEDRAAASMFYIGYQAARFRAGSINVGVIPSIQAQALAYCEENPDRPVVQAFAEAYSAARE
jgi:hypothetical protein